MPVSENVALVAAALFENVTVPGPENLTQRLLTVPGGFGWASSVTTPLSEIASPTAPERSGLGHRRRVVRGRPKGEQQRVASRERPIVDAKFIDAPEERSIEGSRVADGRRARAGSMSAWSRRRVTVCGSPSMYIAGVAAVALPHTRMWCQCYRV